MKAKLFLVLITMTGFLASASDVTPPRVLSTIPANGDRAVNPNLTLMSVTFNESMRDGNWSWAYTTRDTFPVTTGQPRFERNFTKNVLPVRLQPNKWYEVWINSQKFNGFKDRAGNSSAPYKLVFKTRK